MLKILQLAYCSILYTFKICFRLRRDSDQYGQRNDQRNHYESDYRQMEHDRSFDGRSKGAGFVIDDFVQLSNMRPAVTIPTRYEIDAVITKRRRLEVCLQF